MSMNAFSNAMSLRMIDANANRAREALRVMEDYSRFALNDATISAALKDIRHGMATALAAILPEALLARDTTNDVGTTIETVQEFQRDSIGSVVIAAGKRFSEALRVLEECAKTLDPRAAATIEQLRYRGYTVEQQLARFVGAGAGRERFRPVRLYVLLTESLCNMGLTKIPIPGKAPTKSLWESTLDRILAAAPDPRMLCIQLREKELTDAELLRRATIIAQRCREAGALSIMNDRPDIALLAGMDGIHLGQTDLPCDAVRKLIGSDLILGVSTENLEQAHAAVRDGATYVAVGPMFPTTTKIKPRLAGIEYAKQAREALPAEVPLVAIGGITPDRAPQLAAVGIPCVSVCSAVVSQEDPAAAVKAFLATA